MEYVLPDYLRGGLGLVFVGFNPSLKSFVDVCAQPVKE